MANVSPDPWIPADAPLGWSGCTVQTYRVTVSGSMPSTGYPTVTLALLPSVECIAIQQQEGPDPGTAVFRYRFGDGNAASPQDLEQALGTQYTKTDFPDLVEVGDWLGVLATAPSGATAWLFSGFPLEWDGILGEKTENVQMIATGVAKRLWDTPAGGAVWRNSNAVETGGNDVPTGRVCQFNPKGRPNASPSTGDSGSGSYTYPVFMDPNFKGTDSASNAYPRTWSVDMAAALLLFTGNATRNWVGNPTRTAIQQLLISREPISGTPFDPTNPATYTTNPIQASDAPINGKALPILIHDLIQDSGFGMSFPLSGDNTTGPQCAWNLFLKQAGTVKSIYLASRLSPLDTSANNVGAAHLARDLTDVLNQFTIDGDMTRYEASYVLFNGFPSQASDASSLGNFVASSADFETSNYFNSYREFLLDESGEGHYTNLSTTKATTAASLDSVLGAPSGTPSVPQYVKVRRPPLGHLLTPDASGRPLKWEVRVSTNYGGSPGVWDGTGQWQLVSGGVSLLSDRIGFRVNIDDPNKWYIGKSAVSGDPFPDGKLNLVEKIAGGTNVMFMLTCVIEADKNLAYTAAPIGTSPISQTIERRIDARDRLRIEKIYAPSWYNHGGGATTTTSRDDTALATAEAVAMRTAMDSGVFNAEVEIPYVTAYYQVGDKIDKINGRNLGFRTDNGGTGYLPVLPIVAAVRYELGDKQSTHIQLSDSGLNRRRYRRKKSAAIAQVAKDAKDKAPTRPRGIYSTKEVPASERDGTGAV